MISLKNVHSPLAASALMLFASHCLVAQSGTVLPFETDFEATEGYSIGGLSSDANWLLSPDLSASIITPGAASDQAMSFFGVDSLSLLMNRGQDTVTWLDFYLKPAAVDASELPGFADPGQSAMTAFVQVDTDGRIYAVDGDGVQGGQWVESGQSRALDGAIAADWIRLSYRLDYATKTWDLFVDGSLVLTNLGFLDPISGTLDRFALLADSQQSSQIDYFYAGSDNPLFEDTANDGLPDAWLTAQGLSVHSNQRTGDSDFDGLSNLLEFQIGTGALDPDSDADGVSDGNEHRAGASPSVADNYALSALPFYDGFESYPIDTLAGQGNWSLVAGGAAVQEEIVRSGLQALELTPEARVDNALGGSGHGVVWVDLYLKPSNSESQPDLPEGTTVGYYFDETSRPVVFDGSGGQGSGFWTLLDAVGSDDWRRVTVKMDYAAQAYDFYLDGERLGAGLGFAHPQPYISRVAALGGSVLDDLSIAAAEPAGLDDDRDGLINSDEINAGMDPLAFDTDGDGLADSLELLWGLDPNVPDATLAQPLNDGPGSLVWTTSFAISEGYNVGLLDGQQDWLASGLVEVIGAEEAFMPVNWQTDASFERMAGMGEARRIWVGFRAKLVAGPLASLVDYTDPLAAAFGAASPFELALWDGSTSGWTNFPVNTDLEQWNDYALYLDYVEKTWAIHLNGVTVAESLPLLEEQLVTFSRFKSLQGANAGLTSNFEAAAAQFDDIRFATSEPADMDFDGDGLSNDLERQFGSDLKRADTDGDGMPDLWEHQNGLNLLADDAQFDPDGDSLVNVEEFSFGLDPHFADAKGASGFASVEQWYGLFGLAGSQLSALTNDSHFPLSPHRRTLLTELTTDYNEEGMSYFGQRIRGTITAPVSGKYTFWVSGDKFVQLWLSQDATPFGKTLIAELDEGTGYKEWDTVPSQASVQIDLVAGQSYYFEVLHGEIIGADHVSVAWQYPGAERHVIPGDYLASAVDYANDGDEDGLPDDWETAVGLDSTKGYGADGYTGDLDGDGLLNYIEAQVGTSPVALDTDGDGYDDLFEINELRTDPTAAEVVDWVETHQIDGADATFVTGDWAVNNGAAVCRSAAGGKLAISAELPSDGIYQLSCEFARVADSANSQDQPIVLLWYIDNEYLGKTVTDAESGTLNFSELKRTPHILGGEHTITLHWINVYRNHKLAINSIKIEKPTADTPEILDEWIGERVQAFASVDAIASESLVSPLSVEGRGRYLGLLDITPAATPVRAGLGRWYADVPLDSDDNTEINFSFQNSGSVQTKSVQWVPTNVFEHEELRLRVGDAIKLAAMPEGVEEGSFEMLIDGQSAANDLTSYLEHQFNAEGVYTITAIFTGIDGSTTSSSMSVEVIGFPSEVAPIAMWAGRNRTWASPDLPEGVSLETEGMSLSEDGTDYRVARDEPYEDISIVARMDETGPILGSIPTRAFSLRATVEGYLRTEQIDESTLEVENDIFQFGMPEDVDVEIEVFKAGVVLDDGTRNRIVSLDDFDEEGSYTFNMIKPDSVGGGSCHRIHAHQNGTEIGVR